MSLIREAQEERRIANELNEARKEKEIMIKNRIFREEQYQIRRDLDFQEALARESVTARSEIAQHKRDQEMIYRQYKELALEKEEKRKQKHTTFCQEVIHEVVSFAIKVRFIRYKRLKKRLQSIVF